MGCKASALPPQPRTCALPSAYFSLCLLPVQADVIIVLISPVRLLAKVREGMLQTVCLNSPGILFGESGAKSTSGFDPP